MNIDDGSNSLILINSWLLVKVYLKSYKTMSETH